MNSNNTNSVHINYRHSIHRACMLLCIIFMLIPFINFAQDELPRHYTKYNMEIKPDGNQSKSNSQVITQTISEKGASWLRLFLKDVNLGNKSTLTITSTLDGATQILTSKTIKDWKNTTAYFNGDKITLELTVAPGESAIGLTIAELGVGENDPGSKSQCGSTDDRVDSTDNAIGRIVPIGCTGWIITNGKLVTAGHCVGSRAQLIEFNVPKSNPDRTIVHPGPEDQYPIGNFVTNYVRGRPETDWAVFTASANSQTGQTPIQAQGKSFNVVQSAPGNNITITGFGTDTGVDNQTQQTHTGPLSSVNNTFVRYRTDTTGGNSGSPIIDTATGNAVGVHAYGGCFGSGGSNYGERATIPDFWDAMGLGGTSQTGPFYIQSPDVGRRLQATATVLRHRPTTNAGNWVQWYKIDAGNNRYYLKNKKNNKYIQRTSSNALNMVTNQSNATKFFTTNVSNGFGNIRVDGSNQNIRRNNRNGQNNDISCSTVTTVGSFTKWKFINVSSSLIAESGQSEAVENINTFSMYPNPANDIVTLKGISDGSSISIYSLTGQKIKEVVSTGTNQDVNVSKLSRGIYMVRIVASNEIVKLQKLVIK